MAASVEATARLPTPPPAEVDIDAPQSGKKRALPSRSPSPERRAPRLRQRSRTRSRSPPPRRQEALPRDVDRSRAFERQRQMEQRLKAQDAADAKPLTAEERQAAAKKEYERLLTMRSGGTYIPPARLRALQAEIGDDPKSKEYQRMAWEALKKSINGLINKVNVSNIKHIVPELFGENLVRGRGLFCRSIMKAQAASLPFTPIYAAMVAIVNTKLPQVGELLVNRLIVQFRKAFKRNDKSVCLSSTTFLAHLINQQVAHEMLAAQVLLLLLNKPTDDSVEIAVGLMKEIGQHLEEFQAKISMAVYDQFRNILHEADIDKRVQYMIEVLFQIRKDKYKDYPAVKDELDLVEEEDQITHNPGLDDQLDVQDGLNIFKYDNDYEENEEAYKKLKAEILGEAEGSEDDESGSDVSSEDEEEQQREREIEIKDQSNTDLVNLRRTIYLTIMSSGGFEECTHKLLRINLPVGLEHELPSMLIECSSQERTFNKFFALIAERLCKLNRMWIEQFEQQFAKYYETIHRLETNRLRIVAQLFGHLFTSDAISWAAMSAIHLNEEETTSSSRIFIKILYEDLAQGLSTKRLTDRMKDDALQPYLAGVFPTDNPRNTRFSINFFTAIGMGALTEGMREYLKNMPKPVVPALPAPRSPSPSDRSVSSYSSYSSYSSRSRSRDSRSPAPHRGRSYTRSPSRSPARKAHKKASRSPVRPRRSPSYTPSRSRTRSADRRRRPRSISRSRSPIKSRALSPARTNGKRRDQSPAVARGNGKSRARDISLSRSRTPPRRSRRYSDSRSRSPGIKARRKDSIPRSRTPPRRRALSNSRSRSPAQRARGSRRRSPSYSRSRSATPPRKARSPPARRAAEQRANGRAAKDDGGVTQTDLEGMHPARRAMLEGGAGGRGGGGFKGARGRGRPTADSFL